MKVKVGFICVHNSCRSQIAEALGKKYGSEYFDFYSAGTETGRGINADAIRLMKEICGIDMEKSQYPKDISEIPELDYVITMGCNVQCPAAFARIEKLDFGIDDPTGKEDSEFREAIMEIDRKVRKFIEDYKNIRRACESDNDEIMDIWLKENIKVHNFISESYWKKNYEYVRDLIGKSEVYVYEENSKILGFAGLKDNYLEGIFVKDEYQNRGIGKRIMDFLKRLKNELSLKVYSKNKRAEEFYIREKFKPAEVMVDENTGEKEILMIWKK